MIFVTVGTELPFDRMVKTVDQWAGRHQRKDVFAQIGPAAFKPQNIQWAEFLDANDCRAKIAQADVVIAHGGMGSILTALELGKPIVVMPRLASLHEHRSDHQLATVKQLAAQGRVTPAFDEQELVQRLEHLEELSAPGRISAHASEILIRRLSNFIRYGKTDPEDGANAATPTKMAEV